MFLFGAIICMIYDINIDEADTTRFDQSTVETVPREGRGVSFVNVTEPDILSCLAVCVQPIAIISF